MNLEGRRETTNVVDRRGEMDDKKKGRLLREYIEGADDRWDVIAGDAASRARDKYGDNKTDFPDSAEFRWMQAEKAEKQKLEHPEVSTRKDKTRVNPRIGRRRSLEGEDLGEYRM